MASRPLLKPFPVITNGDMSALLTSSVTILDNVSMLSYAVTWSGTGTTGICSVQVSNDYRQGPTGTVLNAGTWNTLPLSITPTISTNTGNGFIDIDANAGYAFRFVYTPSAGTGSMNVIVTGKVQ